MRKKIIGISIVMLLLALIPSTAIATETPEEDSKLLLKGSIIISEIENNTVHGLALRLFYWESIDDERTMGWVTLNKVFFADEFFMIELGKLAFVIGYVEGHGGLEVI